MRGGGVSSCEMSSTCIQSGSTPRPLGGYQPSMMMEPSSPASAWQYRTILPKQEPIDHEERTDSGISGSDCHSSSPGSDHSENIPLSAATQAAHSSAFYSTSFIRMNQTIPMQQNAIPLYHNDPLSPPNSEPTSSPKDRQTTDNTTAFVKTEASNYQSIPCVSPEQTTLMQANIDCDDPLKRLQMTLEKNGLLPSALSPKLSEYSGEDENRSDNESEEYDEQGLRIPKVNSHGKVKTFRCKQCDFVAITKLDFWDHTKSHIKADKLLTCPKCPFVTEYKHHLEYHLRNHFGSKPFKCTQCNYSCVNKSMLNSHLKSHSNIYQYRCAECSYATKYCHSLKLHLRKYKHKPAMVLNPDGTPNPIPIIDVYGTRRGPKVKGHDSKPNEEVAPKPEQMLPFPLSQFMLNAQMQLPFNGFPFFGGFAGALPNPLLLQNLEKLARERQASSSSMQDAMEESSSEGIATEQGVLDLSKPEGSMNKSRRKGRAFKLPAPNGNSSDEEEEETTMFSNVEVVENKDTDDLEEKTEHPMSNNNNRDDYNCQYCQINFGEPVLYTIHMGYHGYKHPFTCNMCGEECQDKISFFLHIARTPHS